jgi:ribosomal protein S18 acetylase RimI-like enzyme
MVIKLVDCSPEYWDFVRNLRMDKSVASGFIEKAKISKSMQQQYMKIYSDNFKIALADNSPAGYIGVIDNDIRVCTSPDYQGQGIGKFMVNECMKIWPNAFAKIKTDNNASLKLFESCGFTTKLYILTKDQ